MRLDEITLSGKSPTKLLKRESGAEYDTYYIEVGGHMYSITFVREDWGSTEVMTVNLFRRVPGNSDHKFLPKRKIANMLDNSWTVMSAGVQGSSRDLLSLYNAVIFLLSKELEQSPEVSKVLMWSDEEQKNTLYHKLIKQNISKLLPDWEEDFMGIRKKENTDRAKENS